MLTKEIQVGSKTIVIRETSGADEERVDRLLRKDKGIETPVAYGSAFGRAMVMDAVQSVDGVEQLRMRDLVQLRERLAQFTSREMRAIEKAYAELAGIEGEANGDDSQSEDGSGSASPSSSTDSTGETPSD